jgi:hypothetical protein
VERLETESALQAAAASAGDGSGGYVYINMYMFRHTYTYIHVHLYIYVCAYICIYIHRNGGKRIKLQLQKDDSITRFGGPVPQTTMEVSITADVICQNIDR